MLGETQRSLCEIQGCIVAERIQSMLKTVGAGFLPAKSDLHDRDAME